MLVECFAFIDGAWTNATIRRNNSLIYIAAALKVLVITFANADYAKKATPRLAHRCETLGLTVTAWGWATGEFHEHL
ncbi:hypothetical protein HORIV_46010 [Vreelandella olivaria]|uniref:Uncharacterized protein n=1 Tax=Vreelandella olivaria TaxID=390919 RepID=A0ABM7GK25_9GAMM|nr:hypothetical protein HORIV_46010 [Halomonas olivaria]